VLPSVFISEQRGGALDRIVRARQVAHPLLIGVTFCVVALTLIGMPPFSGFIGKLMVLQAAGTIEQMVWTWSTLLLSTLCALIAFSRAGTTVFWRTSGHNSEAVPVSRTKYISIWILVLAAPLMSLFAGPIVDFTDATAAQLEQISRTPAILLEGGHR